MEPFAHGTETLDDAAALDASASFDIPPNLADDEEPLLVPPAGAEAADVVDAWSGIEAPVEEFHTTTSTVNTVATVEPPFVRPTATAEPIDEPVATLPPEAEEPAEKGGWIVSILCAGIAIVAVCLLLPLAEENHQLAWQRVKLKSDLAQLQEQVQVNDEFLKKISNDPTLAERLAQRQMKFIRQGSSVLDLPTSEKEELSPFQLVSLPAPTPIPPYQPLGGMMSAVIRNSHLRLYLTGLGLLLLAAGLVLGGESHESPEAD